jgi:hypothetical protein
VALSDPLDPAVPDAKPASVVFFFLSYLELDIVT